MIYNINICTYLKYMLLISAFWKYKEKTNAEIMRTPDSYLDHTPKKS